ncbi:MAG: STAS domain-containing protein [Caldilineales bacterium]|nr:STAS domain-containing protein [Caldilineales bacterium]
MPQSKLTANVRHFGDISVIDIQGDVTGYAEDALMAAYSEASQDDARVIVLNFTNLDYMNSSGIGLLVTLLIRVQRQKQELRAFGLTDHYQQIFELTRLNEAIGIFPSEEAALAG